MPSISSLPWARLIVSATKLRLLHEQALVRLTQQPGLALTPLWLPSPVIQVVAIDGRYLGRARKDMQSDRRGWYAVPLRPARPHGPYRTSRAAARALLEETEAVEFGGGHDPAARCLRNDPAPPTHWSTSQD